MADDLLIIGGGVIGLSLAYELAGCGLNVRVIERGQTGREASWAGAGILPPARRREGDHPLEQLAGLSFELLPRWSEALRESTGIDNGFRRCGGLYVAMASDGRADLDEAARAYRSRDIRAEALDGAELTSLEPALDTSEITGAVYLPEEAQIRNPWHLKALHSACSQAGVQIETGCVVEDFQLNDDRVRRVLTSAGARTADAVCIAGGAWSAGIAQRLGVELTVKPMRGQIVLLRADSPPLRHVVNHGPRYLVPRPDGRLLIGSTEEDVGFDKRTTGDAVAGLITFATRLAPSLGQLEVERSWAGLRPATPDGCPIIGRAADLENAYIATGHFRAGLTLAPATAVVLGELIRGLTPTVDLAAMSPIHV